MKLLTRIEEVSYSNFGRDIDSPERDCLWISSVPPENTGMIQNFVTKLTPRILSGLLFINHASIPRYGARDTDRLMEKEAWEEHRRNGTKLQQVTWPNTIEN